MYSFNSTQATQATQAAQATQAIPIATNNNNNISNLNYSLSQLPQLPQSQIQKSDLINSFLQYIYISLSSYPPPNIVTVKFNSSENININTICKSIATKLNIPVVDIIFGCTRYSNSNSTTTYANLILTDEDIKKLIENDIIPFIKPDYSTIVTTTTAITVN